MNIISIVFEAISLTFILIGGIFALMKWTQANKVRKAEFIQKLYEKLRENPEIVKANRLIDYETPYNRWYMKETKGFINSDVENTIDNYFTWLSYICYLKTNNCISNKDFELFEYGIVRVMKSYSSMTYLWNLYHFSLKNGVNIVYFPLLNYGFSKKLIDKKTFIDKSQSLYPSVINI